MWKGLLAILVAGFIGGQSPLLLKLAQREMSPIFLTEVRFVIASFVLLPFFLQQANRRISAKEFWYLFTRSIFFSLNVIVFSIAIQYTTTVMSQILYAIGPIFVVILSYYMLHEKLTMNRIVGLAFSLLGLIFLMLQSIGESKLVTFGSPLGNILTLCAVFSWGLYLIYSKQLTRTYSPVVTSFMSFITTVVLLLPLTIIDLGVNSVMLHELTFVSIGSALVLGVVSSALMFFLVQYGIKKTTAFTGSLLQYIGPFAAAVTAVPILNEKINASIIIGGFFVIAGVFYATTYENVRQRMKSMLQ